jgi:hypothetical protein
MVHFHVLYFCWLGKSWIGCSLNLARFKFVKKVYVQTYLQVYQKVVITPLKTVLICVNVSVLY